MQEIYSPYKKRDLIHIERGLIFFAKAGSHAYGLNTPESDLDLRGIYMGPPKQVFGIASRTEQYDKFTFADTQIWELRKFLKLASACNPNMVEILFTPENSVIYSSIWWEMLQDIRNLFLSKQAAGKFCGYADGQLKRIKGHRKWINNPQPKEEPKQKDFMKSVFDRDDARKYVTVPDHEAYKGAHRKWEQYWLWKRKRNLERAFLEEKHGFDTKHAMHLIRLLRMGREIILGEGIIMDRSQIDRTHLLNIRNGKVSYEEVVQEGEVILQDIKVLEEQSDLPKRADKKLIEKVMLNMYFSYWDSLKSVKDNYRKLDIKWLLEMGRK